MKLAGCLLAVMLIGAGPATKPATTIYELRKQVDAMAAEIAELRAAIQELQARIPAADAKQPDAGDASIMAAIKDRRIIPGMTIADVRKAMNYHGDLVEESAGEMATFKFFQLNERKTVQAEYEVVFVKGQVSRYSRLDDPVKRLRIPPGPPASFK